MRNGAPVAMVMPSGFYEIMTDRDPNAVIAYLRTIEADSRHVVPETPSTGWRKDIRIRRCGEKPVARIAMLSDNGEARCCTSARLRTAWSADAPIGAA